MAAADAQSLASDVSELLDKVNTTVPELQIILATEGRPALLTHLKESGVPTLGQRQRLCNSLGRLARLEAEAAREREITVVYIHIGYRPYVEAAVRVTASHHPRLVILGDESMRQLERSIPGVEVVDIAQFRRDEAILAAKLSYRHNSSNPRDFEFFCFERIFILRRFLQSRGLTRCLHLDSDCVLLRPLSDYPLHERANWLVNNDFYHLHGFSPVPSASIHAALLTTHFCEQFERLYDEYFAHRCARLPRHVAELMRWAEEHCQRGGAGGVSDMTFYFLLQARPEADAWAGKTLGWVEDVGDLGSIRAIEGAGGPGGHQPGGHQPGGSQPGGSQPGGRADEEEGAAALPVTWMNNINTGEGPDGARLSSLLVPLTGDAFTLRRSLLARCSSSPLLTHPHASCPLAPPPPLGRLPWTQGSTSTPSTRDRG